MAQALSEEEFHRMQLNSVRQKTSNLEKDYVKAQKALSKSKKAQEVDALINENKMLQGKLHSQEDDFRLQNSTLMQELSKIEQLESENHTLREGQGQEKPTSSLASAPGASELLRLQAENSSLQKKLIAFQEQVDVNYGKGALGDGSAGTNGVQSDGSGYSDEHSAPGNDQTDQAGLQSGTSEPRDQEMNEVALKGRVELEEKCLLREQLQLLEVSKQTEITKLTEENSKLSEKLKKKQESFQRLQVEKEALYNDSRTKIDEIQQRKEEELKSINLRVQKLQADLMTANLNVAELKEQLQSKQKEHEMAIHALKDQVACQSAVSQEQVENMLSENEALRTNLAALEQIQTVKTQEQNLLREQNLALNTELQQRRTEQESFLAQRDDLSSQLQESNRANGRLLEQVAELGLEKDKLQQDLEEARKTADKRKVMLDELAIETAQEKSRHKEELGNVRLQHEKEARTKELEGLQPYVEELKAQVQSMEGTKGWFERRLKEAEEAMEKTKLDHSEEIEQIRKDHTFQLEGKASDVEAAKQQVILMEKEREDLNVTISKLKQEIKDTVDGQRILEKKGSSALKDLKRQLHLERKRADKLQERLQEILTNTKTRTGLEELVLSEISSPSRTQQTGDSSSISSFSYREIMKDGASAPSTNKSNTSSPQSQRPADLSDDEVSELFQRLAEVQQEKWMLEEKVKHLEVSCASMADDICKKSAIIETYVMDSRRDVSGGGGVAHGAQADRGGLSSVLRDLDLEVLSQEIVRLSKDTTTPAEPSKNTG
ncbi:hypothetical protein DNTS_009507 [Danionella cerebrum]|uniref:GRIP1-associated protein 1 n=1 Tax=Danionella cerebrum TaxID=2873325 RepID=A0A553P537_9TELE|nr:hypothetical protein DNTS_009507 [Danionella translucida]TRY72805.1 hypothetical protein DNTS_009507 [Danionella translucida]TRY72806.1 hypothetical protein DNTS_009507 [Danionella translucida]